MIMMMKAVRKASMLFMAFCLVYGVLGLAISSEASANKPEKEDKLKSATATNGTIVVTFKKSPGTEPALKDFEIYSVVNKDPAVRVTPKKIAWDGGNKQATLTVPAISVTDANQTVYYRLSYRDGKEIRSDSFVVPAGVAIVKNGQGRATVVVPAGASEQVSKAANKWIEYVKKSTGVDVPRKTPAELTAAELSGGKALVYIGGSRPGDTQRLNTQLQNLDDDGYVIDTHANTVTIIGRADSGTEYGVYEFLERYAGVRWLMPGPDGEDVPHADLLIVPPGTVKEQPAIKSRELYGVHTPSFYFAPDNKWNYEWGKLNRVNNRIIGYQHNLWYLFLPMAGLPGEHYGTEHPEFYPMRNGERFIPTSDVYWQPCFTEPGTVTAAVDSIVAYFNAHPQETSFSLAVNDGGGFCEAEPDHPKNPHKLNSLGLPDMSDIYYNWVNKVVEGVLKVHPDKWFGLLAYQEVNDPPSFPLNSRVIPYFTKDRMAWIDPGIRTSDQSAIERWNAVSANLAFYDYVYGAPYMVPRVYPHQMAEYLRYGKEHGVIAYFAELVPNWGEGPKPWLLTKLLWNPDQDVDALLNDWYVRAVGPDAAPDLKAYYDHWEQFWTERIKSTDWFETRKGITYLSYYWGTYLEAITDEEIADSRRLLESVVAKAQTEAQKARAEVLLRQFEYYEASALSYPKKVAPPADKQAALQLLEEGIRSQVKADYAQKRLDLVEQFDNDPLLHHQNPPTNDGLVWSGWSPSLVWSVVDYVKQNEPATGPVRERIAELASGDDEAARNYALLLQHALSGTTINANPSFEAGGDSAQSWDSWIFNYGEFKRIEDPQHARTGNASIYVHNFYYGNLSQTVPVKPGLIVAKMSYYVTPETRTVGDTWLQLDLLDENDNVLQTFKSNQQPYSANRGKWNDVSVMGNVPEAVGGVPVKKVKVSNTVNGFFEGGTMYMDDFEVYQSAESDPLPPIVVSEVEAEDGSLKVHFLQAPDEVPTTADFSVIQRINGGTAVAIVPAAIDWNAADNIAVLTVPGLTSQIWDQSVTYVVTYRNTAAANSSPFVKPGMTEGLQQVVRNASFEEWNTAIEAKDWTFWGEGFTRSDTVKRTGAHSLAADGLQPGQNEAGGGGPFQTVDLEPGHYVGVFYYNTAAKTSGKLSWSVQPKDTGGNILRTVISDKRPAAVSNGAWIPFEFEFDIEPGETSARFFVLLNDFRKGDTIYFDDVEIYKIPPVTNPITVVEATYGAIDVSLGIDPTAQPTAADFKIMRSINGAAETAVVPGSITWDANSRTATIGVPEVPDRLWDQSVIYRVSYLNHDPVSSSPLEITGDTDGLLQLVQNGSFEQWNSETEATNWNFWGEGFTRSAAVKRTGSYSLVADGLQPGQNDAGGGGPFQLTVPVEPGHYVGIFRFNTNVPTNGKLTWGVHLRDGTGNVTSAINSSQRPAGISRGNWIPFEYEFDVAPGTASINFFIVLNDFNKGDTIYFDDVEIFKTE